MNEPVFEAWNVSENKFPREGSNVDKLTFFLRYAVLAPSSHNTQPWLFKIVSDKNMVEVYADRTRALPVVDPEDRALIISCGAALCFVLPSIFELKSSTFPFVFLRGLPFSRLAYPKTILF